MRFVCHVIVVCLTDIGIGHFSLGVWPDILFITTCESPRCYIPMPPLRFPEIAAIIFESTQGVFDPERSEGAIGFKKKFLFFKFVYPKVFRLLVLTRLRAGYVARTVLWRVEMSIFSLFEGVETVHFSVTRYSFFYFDSNFSSQKGQRWSDFLYLNIFWW